MLKLLRSNHSVSRLFSELTLRSRPVTRVPRPFPIPVRARFHCNPILSYREDDTCETASDLREMQKATAIWSKEELLGRISALLNNPKREELERIYKANKKALKVILPRLLTENVQLLLQEGVNERSILNHPRILSIDSDEIVAKINTLKKFKGLQDLNHMIPFLKLDQAVLEDMVNISQQENIEHGNRIYYLEAQTGVDVEVIAHYFANSIRVYSRVGLEKFLDNLEYCLQNLEPLDVVRHLSILAYARSSIEERLRMLKSSPLEKVKPWMIRVPNLALERSFEEIIDKGRTPSFKDPLTGVWFENHVSRRIMALIDCTEEEAKSVYKDSKGSVSVIDNIEELQEWKISQKTILNNRSLLGMMNHELKKKIGALNGLVGVRDLNDLIPLCALKPFQVIKLVRAMNNDELSGNTNRIYHFADRTGIAPSEVANQFARRTFMFRIPKESFLENLEQFIAHMDPEDVLADLWAFKYSPAVVHERLARAKEVRGRKLMPWMVRCPDVVLEKSLQLTKENGALLGENETIVEYFQRRLGFDREITNSIFLKLPSVKNIRITKVKKVIDYLLEELDYLPQDIALNPRILMHSLTTTRKRMAQLQELGCRPSSLVVVCKSQVQYEKFIKDWIEAKDRKKKIQVMR
ncbi:uncharacterized protein LOC129746643 [Uranotaenia lowii]|uniref:uncharacterized protein LOC129746643 n=1 Tax=Uranotaenia lowii TaxID=190385 RepID=UPI0024795D4A|nr:uncharacterized protein LOC129746643 [Uranotaenia lowii]